MTYRKKAIVLSIALAFGLGLTACSSSDDDDDNPSNGGNGGNGGGGTGTVEAPSDPDQGVASSVTSFEATSYRGYVDPTAADDWTADWTVALHNNDSVWQPVGTPSASSDCPAGTTFVKQQVLPDIDGDGSSDGSMDLCQLQQEYLEDVHLTNKNIYALAEGFPGTRVGDGQDTADREYANVTMTIDKGTLILGSSQEALVVTRGSKIEAIGTAEDPIVMTSSTQFTNWVSNGDATSGRGEWAGLALMGQAKEGRCADDDFDNCNVEAEGGIGSYGGNDDADSSGTVQYVVVRHAGNDLDGNGNELNGFTLFSVGSGTNINYVQVHKGLDDGIEHFGSTDFMHHIVLTDNRDDSFDWGHGYTGGVQYMVIRQAEDEADHGIEADNNKSPMDDAPRSAPTIQNMTIFGSTTSDNAVRLRRGTGAHISNSQIISANGEGCFEVHDGETLALQGGDLTVENTSLTCISAFSGDNKDGAVDLTTAEVEAFFTAGNNNVVQQAFLGDEAADWTEGWTVSVHGNDSVWEPAGTVATDGTCPAGTTFVSAQNLPDIDGDGNSEGQMDLCQLPATVTENTTLTADNIYAVASGFPGTKVGNGDKTSDRDFADVTLTVEAGTLILGSAQEALVITRGSKIEATGTAEDPIVMTSSTQFTNWVDNGDATSGRGEWAGFALMGQAHEGRCADDNFAACNVEAEGGIGSYGGDDNADSSGSISFVVVRHAGNDLDGNGNELNGFTLFSVGSGTSIDHVQVHKGLDDGIEHFGSTDSMSNIVLTGNGDDSFDWGHGYTGSVDKMLIIQHADKADHGIEADNNKSPMDDAPRSNPTITNMTILGSGTSDNAIRFRRGTGVNMSDSQVVAMNPQGCLEVHDGETLPELQVTNTTLTCMSHFNGENKDGAVELTTEEVETFFTSGNGNVAE